MIAKTIIKRLLETFLALLAIPLMIVFGFASLIASGHWPTGTEFAWASLSGLALAAVLGLFFIIEKYLWVPPGAVPVMKRRTIKVFAIAAVSLAGVGALAVAWLALIAINGL